MDEGIPGQAEVFRSRIAEVLRENNGRLKFSEKNFELFSEIIDFQGRHKITTAQFSELLGISSFRISYIRKKILAIRKLKKSVKMKRIKIMDVGLGDIRLKTPSGFEILFSRLPDIIEFVRVFR